MTEIPKPLQSLETHEVCNQSGEPPDHNAYAGNNALREAIEAFGAGWASTDIHRVGEFVGSGKARALARDAERFAPVLLSHDRFGRRVDIVEFHPAYHDLMAMVFASGVHCLPRIAPRDGSQVARAALSYLWNQAENGVCCPVAMTFAASAALEHDAEQAEYWAPLLNSRVYDRRPITAGKKLGITVGMAMTEKQGGSDLRQTQTTARPAGSATGSGAEYLLTGHKWFFSAPMSDLILTLARTEKGVNCFLARGWLEDGTRNGLRIERLKDKCGNRANASSEVEFHDLRAAMLGEEGRGLATVMKVAHLTRLECGIGSAGVMRNALAQVKHHVENREAFGARLIDQPLMRNVVADLALESEAALWLVMRLAKSLDLAGNNEYEALLSRIGVPVAKYWICKRTPQFVAEAMEAQGGNGYVEEGPMGRLFRESPLNGIWEGASNVICLDVLRALERNRDCAVAFLDETGKARGHHRDFDRALDELEKCWQEIGESPSRARRVVESMALVLQASLLIRYAPDSVAVPFCNNRLAESRRCAFGTLNEESEINGLIARIDRS